MCLKDKFLFHLDIKFQSELLYGVYGQFQANYLINKDIYTFKIAHTLSFFVLSDY